MSSSDLELLKRFRNNTEWFDDNYHSLKKYGGQFIAIYNESIIDSDIDSRRLIDRTKRLYDKSLYVSLVTSSGTVSPAK
jgi:hypothetical protein